MTFEYLSALGHDYAAVAAGNTKLDNVTACLTEGQYEDDRDRLYQLESQILRVLAFQTQVALPYALCINYMQTLDVFALSSSASLLAKRAFAHLNTALLSPQLLLLTHQPPILATAAIYLAAKEVGVKLPEVEWWEVFDVDRESLGFVVVALQSVDGFAVHEQQEWGKRKVPLTVEGLRSVMERRAMLEAGE